MVDLRVLRQEIRGLTCRKMLFKVLKEELTVLGYWKNKPRGNPEKALVASNEAKARAEGIC